LANNHLFQKKNRLMLIVIFFTLKSNSLLSMLWGSTWPIQVFLPQICFCNDEIGNLFISMKDIDLKLCFLSHVMC
jgi:hypothetical protein